MSLLLCAANECGKRPMMRGGDLKAVFNRVVKHELGFTKSNQKVLDKYGDEPVTAIEIKRYPIQLSFAVKDLGMLDDKPFDELFHILAIVTCGKTKIRVEKHAVITITVGDGEGHVNTESLKIFKIPKNKTLNNMLELTKEQMGSSSFHKYDAISNNCQVFLENLLSSNRMGRSASTKFIMQDTSDIVSEGGNSALNYITRLLGIGQTLVD
jgi:hypothetical protein